VRLTQLAGVDSLAGDDLSVKAHLESRPDTPTPGLAAPEGMFGGNAKVQSDSRKKVHPVSRMVVSFAKGGYATEYEILLSADGNTWHTVVHVTGCKGGVAKHSFPPTGARYVRVRALKPDGPNQEGTQMIVNELEVYEAR